MHRFTLTVAVVFFCACADSNPPGGGDGAAGDPQDGGDIEGGSAGSAGSADAGGAAAGGELDGQGVPGDGDGADADADDQSEGGAQEPSSEVCNALDDDGDGLVDEDIACLCGWDGSCYGGLPETRGIGACGDGVRQCDVTGEFWGPCEGWDGPIAEVCDNGIDDDCDGQVDEGCDDGIDNNCDGRVDEGCQECLAEDLCFDGIDNDCDGLVDEDCGAQCAPGAMQDCFPGPGNPGVGQCVAGAQTCNDRGFWGACVGAITAAVEDCEDGVDQDCDGADLVCGPVQVPIFLIGDCVTAACPQQTPHPVGCTVFFTPGDDRGCVANRPGESSVYFQAGNSCSRGLVTGTLLCSEIQGAGLNAANCPVNKPIVLYPDSRAGCPATAD